MNKTFALIRLLALPIICARRPHARWILDTGNYWFDTHAFLLLWSWSG